MRVSCHSGFLESDDICFKPSKFVMGSVRLSKIPCLEPVSIDSAKILEGKILPYYRKLTLLEIKVLEINTNLRDDDFLTKEVNAKERITFQNEIN